MYTTLNWCDGGGTGAGWDDSWGTLGDLVDPDGFIATDVCCGCMDEASPVFESRCQDSTGSVWLDTDGLSCADYEAREYCNGKVIARSEIILHCSKRILYVGSSIAMIFQPSEVVYC